MQRETVVVQGPLAGKMQRYFAASERAVGREIMTLPHLAARLAGGFVAAPGADELYPAIKAALEVGGFASLRDVAALPGMPRAVLETLSKVWKADLDLAEVATGAGRLADLMEIERRVRAGLGAAWLVPPALRDAAISRARYAPTLLGSVHLHEVLFVDPVWRPLILELCRHVEVTMHTAQPDQNGWFTGRIVALPLVPPEEQSVDSCADPRAEVLEALRWVRHRLVHGADAADVAVTSPSATTYDEHFLVMRREGLPIYFAHGIPALSTSDGQACAALADVLLRGLDQDRVRRLFRSLPSSPTRQLVPADWAAGLRGEAGLFNIEQWSLALATTRDLRSSGEMAEKAVIPILRLLTRGADAAVEVGELLLRGESLAIWKRALRSAPADALAISLQHLRVPDAGDPANSVVWCPADQLAASPRKIVRLLGMNVRSWPRGESDDPLLPDHLLPRRRLSPISSSERDRAAFRAITGRAQVVALSLARRNFRGSIQSPSPLWPKGKERELSRLRIPEHAFSEVDRLLARPTDARTDRRVQRTRQLWRAWHSHELTPAEGVLPADHPIALAALARTQSASSLRLLLRDQQAFVWSQGLGWYPKVLELRPLALDARSFGELTHEVLSLGLRGMDQAGGVQTASNSERMQAFAAAADQIAVAWPLTRAVPPGRLWLSALAAAQDMAMNAVTMDDSGPQKIQTWTELRFGAENEGEPPWGPEPVPIAGTQLVAAGRIDRLDLADNRSAVRVTDYKTSRLSPEMRGRVLAGGAELQRVLYASAAKHLLRDVPRVVARLTFLGDGVASETIAGDELTDAISAFSSFVGAAAAVIKAGNSLPGPDTYDEYSRYRIARPADLNRYRTTKSVAFESAQATLQYGWSLP